MKKKRIIIVSALCLAGGLVWFITESRRAPEIRNIILISMDATRADHLSCYGYPKNTTPNIDAFAQSATRFEKAITTVPITLPAHSSMLTGLIPPALGVHANHSQLADSNQTLPEILKPEGFHTAAIVSSFVLYEQFGLSQGFDTYDDTFKEKYDNKFGQERKGDETTQLVLNWLEQNKDGKSFLFLHYYDPHLDYVPPEPFASEFAGDPYAGEIAFTDHCIGRVIQKLKDLELYESTLLIITGDHGEMLGDHGEDEHSYFIYESAIKVPFIIKLPGQKQALTISEPVGLVDIVPTICSLLKIDTPAGIQGQDISPMLHGRVPEDYERFLYSESVGPGRVGASSLMSITHGKWKYIQAPRPELYDLNADPGEEHNLVESEPQRARILEDKLRETLGQSVHKDPGSGIELDAASIKRLESLGYVAGKSDGPLVFDEDKPDPKDLIHVYQQLTQAVNLKWDNELEKSREMLEDLITQIPNCTEIYIHLGEICRYQGEDDQAVRYYRHAYAIDPKSILITYPLLNDLAWVQAARPSLASRNVDEAVKYAREACERVDFKDPTSMDTLAVAYAAAGDYQKAANTARIALRMASSSNDKELAQEIAKHLKLFEQSMPYVEE